MRADLDKKPEAVAAMFDRVAKRYDAMNFLASLGQVEHWRRQTTRAVVTEVGLKVLDVAAGTGTSTATFVKAGAQAIAADFSEGMMEVGRQRHPELEFRFADAMNLPFADNSFDCVTISFGLRNVQDPEQALREFLRVTKPGGHLVVCEFSRPTFGPFRALYRAFLRLAMPLLAKLASSNDEAYDYLADSILTWPDQHAFGRQIESLGWERAQFKNLSLGIVALHRAYKPVEVE